MASKFSELELLTAVFKPSSKTSLPGLRRRTITGKSWKASRRTAFNKMPAKNQEVLRRAGMQDSYLRGESTLAQAKAKLREKAVSAGIVKPTKPRNKTVQTPREPTWLEVARHIDELASQGANDEHPINKPAIGRHAKKLVNQGVGSKVLKIDSYRQFIDAMDDEQYDDPDDDGVSLLWYH